jgi:hypothetical protein
MGGSKETDSVSTAHRQPEHRACLVVLDGSTRVIRSAWIGTRLATRVLGITDPADQALLSQFAMLERIKARADQLRHTRNRMNYGDRRRDRPH